MRLSVWSIVTASMLEEPFASRQLERSRLYDWLGYINHDYDDVDRLYIDHETRGGD